jgi:hypothetical protein
VPTFLIINEREVQAIGTIGRKDLGNTAMKALLAFSLVLLTTGCSVTKPPTLTPTPLIPYSAAADVLVWLEDQCEDPVEDAITYTTIEAVSDLLALPIILAVASARIMAYMTVGLALEYAGEDHEFIYRRIDYVLPLPYAGPNPDVVRYPRRHPGAALDAEAYKVKPHESCLF